MTAPTVLDHNAVRRSELVLAAYGLFLSEGYRNVGVADIVARVGVSHGTFYNYFDNKRHILDAVIDHCLALIGDRALDSVTAESVATLDEFCANFGQVISRLFELVDAEPGMVNFVLFEASSIDNAVIERFMQSLGTYRATATEHIANGVQRGFLDPSLDVGVAGEVLLSVMMAAMVSAIRDGADGLDPDQVTTGLTDFVRAGFGAG
jgi:AcrR family transcriptional regulator